MYFDLCQSFSAPNSYPRKAIFSRSVRSVKYTFLGVVSPLALLDFGQIPLCNVYLLRQFSQATQLHEVESPSSNQLQLLFHSKGRQVVVFVPAFSNILSEYCEEFLNSKG